MESKGKDWNLVMRLHAATPAPRLLSCIPMATSSTDKLIFFCY